MKTMSTPLVAITRGELVESLHRGFVAIVDADGRIPWCAGDPMHVTYFRSSAKPIQVLPIIASGAIERFGFTDKELAVMAASHHGQDCHIEAVLSILHKIGLDESHLACGTHRPTDAKQSQRLVRECAPVTPVYNNCSGKHAGMLAYAMHMGYPTEGYVDINHPVQVDMWKAVAEVCGLSPDEVVRGVDGCGVVVFGMPVASMAYGYARLAQPETMPARFREAASRITRVIMAYPEMIGGTTDFGTKLMQALPGRVVAKGGAEGLFCLGAVERGIGVCVKIEDGSPRALPAAVAETLKQLGLVGDETHDDEELASVRPIRNHRGDSVGYAQACFRLEPYSDCAARPR